MPEPTRKGKGSRARRAEEFWNRVTLLVGCGAVVGIVASVIVVLTQQLMRPPLVDEAYLVAELQHEVHPSPAATSGATEAEDAAEVLEPRLSTFATAREPAPESNSPTLPAIPIASSHLPKAIAVQTGIDDMEGKRDKIARSVEAFFNASTVDAKAAMVRDPVRVKPLMMHYYAREPMPVVKWRGLGRLVRVDEPGYRFGYVQALFEDATSSNLIVEETDAGDFLIDWECLVRYGEVSWTDFLRMRPADPKLMRVIASRSAAPPASGTEPQGSEWLELRHPAESGTVLGWFDRADPRFAALVQQLEQGQWKDVPVTLRLCFPEAPSKIDSASAHIAGVEGKGWLILRGEQL